jgi:hypothetical protein
MTGGRYRSLPHRGANPQAFEGTHGDYVSGKVGKVCFRS